MKQKIFKYTGFISLVFAGFLMSFPVYGTGGTASVTIDDTFTIGTITISVIGSDKPSGKAVSGSATVTLKAAPTASFSISPSSAKVGDKIDYTWSSAHGTAWGTTVTANPSSCPGTGTWGAGNTAKGSSLGNTVIASQSGCVYTFTYTVTGPGGSPATAVATLSIGAAANGSCGAAATTYAASASNFTGNLCTTGSTVNSGGASISPTFPSSGSNTTWYCSGVNGGSISGACTATRSAAASPPTATMTINGKSSDTVVKGASVTWAWSSTNGSSYSSTLTATPSSCPDTHGAASATANGTISGTVPATYVGCTYTNTYTVTSSSGQTVSASASLTVTDSVTSPGVCGSANGVASASKPTTNLCASGSTASVVSGSGPWTWTCTKDTATSCSAPTETSSSCTFTVTPGSVTLDEKDQDSSGFIVIASSQTCSWTATELSPQGWISNLIQSGTGSGQVSFHVSAFTTTGTSRTSMLSIGGGSSYAFPTIIQTGPNGCGNFQGDTCCSTDPKCPFSSKAYCQVNKIDTGGGNVVTLPSTCEFPPACGQAASSTPYSWDATEYYGQNGKTLTTGMDDPFCVSSKTGTYTAAVPSQCLSWSYNSTTGLYDSPPCLYYFFGWPASAGYVLPPTFPSPGGSVSWMCMTSAQVLYPSQGLTCTASRKVKPIMPNMTDSGKQIIKVNSANTSAYTGHQCNSFVPLPSGTTLNTGDILTFRLDLCNDQGTAPATVTQVTDIMLNMQRPDAGYQAKYCYNSSCASITPTEVINGNITTLTFSLSSNNILAIGGIGSITYKAQISAPADSSVNSSRINNKFTINYNSVANFVPANANIGYIPYYSGVGVPTIKEVR